MAREWPTGEPALPTTGRWYCSSSLPDDSKDSRLIAFSAKDTASKLTFFIPTIKAIVFSKEAATKSTGKKIFKITSTSESLLQYTSHTICITQALNAGIKWKNVSKQLRTDQKQDNNYTHTMNSKSPTEKTGPNWHKPRIAQEKKRIKSNGTGQELTQNRTSKQDLTQNRTSKHDPE